MHTISIGATMSATLYFTVDSSAWLYLRDLPPHLYRKDEVAFNGKSFIKIDHTYSAKGLADALLHFLFNPTPHIPDLSTYSRERPYPILPQSFVDMREWASSDYELCAPGVPFPYELYFAALNPITPAYTNWGTGNSSERHGIYIDPYLKSVVFSVTSNIVDYWHISLPSSRMPKNSAEKFSAFMSAIGLGYLQHAGLPHHHGRTPGIRQV